MQKYCGWPPKKQITFFLWEENLGFMKTMRSLGFSKGFGWFWVGRIAFCRPSTANWPALLELLQDPEVPISAGDLKQQMANWVKKGYPKNLILLVKGKMFPKPVVPRGGIFLTHCQMLPLWCSLGVVVCCCLGLFFFFCILLFHLVYSIILETLGLSGSQVFPGLFLQVWAFERATFPRKKTAFRKHLDMETPKLVQNQPKKSKDPKG